MNLSEYKELYEKILEMSFDMDGVSAYYNITDEDVEKCKFIAAIYNVLDDVPKSKMECLFMRKKIKFDYIEFCDGLDY